MLLVYPKERNLSPENFNNIGSFEETLELNW